MNQIPGDNIKVTGTVPAAVPALGQIIAQGAPQKRVVAKVPPAPSAPPPVAQQFRGTRASVLAGIAASTVLDAETIAWLLKRVNALPAAVDLVSVHYHESAYKAGSNGKWTVSEL